MNGTKYAALREKNLQEQNQKLKELGFPDRGSPATPSNKSTRRDSLSDEGTPIPKRAKLSRGAKQSRRSYYNDDPDDPDFDADDPDALDESEDNFSESSRSSVQRGKPGRRGRPAQRVTITPTVNPAVFVDVDKYLYCEDCKLFTDGDCPKHGALAVINDTEVAADPDDEDRARKTAPDVVSVSSSGREVLAAEDIPPRTRFGPFQGKIIYGAEAGPFSWEVKKKGKVLHCVDAKNPGLSNWMRYVNRTRNNGQQNLNAFQYQGKIFYRSIRPIKAKEELVVWGGSAYGPPPPSDDLKKPVKEVKGNSTSYKCPACQIAYVAQDYVDRHMKTCRALRNKDRADEVHKCPGCFCAYSSKDYLDRHRKTCRKLDMSKDPGVMHKCSGCMCAYSTADYLERHQKLCKQLEAKRVPHEVFPCPGCKSAYSSKDYLDRHLKTCKALNNKLREKVYKCDTCQAAYGEEKYLERHQKNCREKEKAKGDSALKHECPTCHSVYIDVVFLERHKKVCDGVDLSCVNGKEKPSLECPGCNNKYGNGEFLDRHKMECPKLIRKRPGSVGSNAKRSLRSRKK